MPRLGIESAIDGNSRARGLVTYIACARVRDAAWVQEKRPAAADVFSAHFSTHTSNINITNHICYIYSKTMNSDATDHCPRCGAE